MQHDNVLSSFARIPDSFVTLFCQHGFQQPTKLLTALFNLLPDSDNVDDLISRDSAGIRHDIAIDQEPDRDIGPPDALHGVLLAKCATCWVTLELVHSGLARASAQGACQSSFASTGMASRMQV